MISICLLRQLKAQLRRSHLPHKFAQIAQIQVANITGRLLCFQPVAILVDSSQVWKVSLWKNLYATRWLGLLWRMPWILVMLYLVLSRYWHRTFIQTYSATSPFNPHWEMDKTFSPSCSSSQIIYVEAEAAELSRFRFRFHRKRTASSSTFLSKSTALWLINMNNKARRKKSILVVKTTISMCE